MQAGGPTAALSGPLPAAALTRLQVAGAVVLLLASVAGAACTIGWAERAYWIAHDDGAWWITAPQPPARLKAFRVRRESPVPHVFERSFLLGEVPDEAVVRVRALRELALFVNGSRVPLEGRHERSWKRAVAVDLAPWLVPGRNRMRAEVVHRDGPAMLQVRGGDLGERLGTRSRGWRLQVGSRRMRPVVASDVRSYPLRERLPSPAEELARRWPLLLGSLLACGLPFLVPLPRTAWLSPRHAPRLAFAAVAAFWAGLFASKALGLPLYVGFDAEAHLEYLDLLGEGLRVPRADEGWETFQPPLYYAATALLRDAFGSEHGSSLDRGLVRLLPMLGGLASAWLAGATFRQLYPSDPKGAAVAVLAAGLLPMNVYMSVFASPEAVHAALLGAAVWTACAALAAPRASTASLAAVSGILGVALLTKSTSGLPVAALLVAALGFKLWQIEGRPPARALAATAALTAGPLLLAGWFYARNAWLFGDPFVTNLNAQEEWGYWIPPGFHTADWFLGFGEVLSRPYLSAFASYWDGLYASFWGDGAISGRAAVEGSSPFWSYGAMAPVYLLALPATAVLAAGLVRTAADALRGPDRGRRVALSMLLVLVFGMFALLWLLTLRMPYYPMPKAFYALPAVVPLGVVFARGVEGVHGLWPGRAMRALLGALLGSLAVWIAYAFVQ